VSRIRMRFDVGLANYRLVSSGVKPDLPNSAS
jgi:hypothetical protein